MRLKRSIPVAAIAAATFFSCVPVSEHQEALAQLRVEQDRLREHERRILELASLNASLGRRLRLAEITREEAREKLELASREMPLVIRQEPGDADKARVLIASIPFDHASVEPAGADLAGLAETIQQLAPRSYAGIVVEGHSDPIPIGPQSDFASNMQISTLRALAIYHHVASLGRVEASKIRLSAVGEHGLRQRLVQVWMVPIEQ